MLERKAYVAGLKPDEFYDSTILEVLLMIQGYGQRVRELWQIGRFQAYIVYCSVTDIDKRVSIFDFFQLTGDPSEEERQMYDDMDLLGIYEYAKQTFLKN